MLCVIRHSHLLASLSDYVTLMIVFHLKAISNMKCLLPFQGTLFSYLLRITHGILHDVSVSHHQLCTIFLSLPEEKLNLDQSDWEDIHVVTGALKLFFRELPEPLVPFGFFTDIVETVSEWTASSPSRLLYMSLSQRAWVLFHAGWQSFQLTAASKSCH